MSRLENPRFKGIWSIALAGLSACFWGCEDEVAPLVDDVAPIVTASLIFPAGGGGPIDQAEYLVAASSVRIDIGADEPATIFYTTDGSEPGPGSGGRGTNSASIRLLAETLGDAEAHVRWLVEDRAGNRAPPGEVRVRLDIETPVVFLDPPPGEYDAPIEVVIDVDEAVDLVYWTVNGGMPRAGTAGSMSGVPPVTIQLARDSVVRAAAADAAGNRFETTPQVYVIDGEPPVTTISPLPGQYLAPIMADIAIDDPEGQIHFTLDGGEPTADSPTWDGPMALDASTTVRFRGIDFGGNAEPVQMAAYTIGPRPARPPVRATDAYDFNFDGDLHLASALAAVAGPLAGRADAPSTAYDWTAYATARVVLDAALFQSAIGVHALRSPAFGAFATSGEGSGDANGNGSVLDDTFTDRIAAMAERSGALVPRGLHPLALFYSGARAELLQPAPDTFTDDGRPSWDDAFLGIRWKGARANQRVAGPAATGAGLRALAARARIGSTHEHATGDDAFGTEVAPVLALRCGGCHRANQIAPVLARAADYIDNALVVPGDVALSPVVGLLAGSTPHPVDPATPAQRAQVTAWIADGALAAGAARALGRTPRDGLMAQVAADTAAHALSIAADWLFFDPATRRLADADVGRYHIARARVDETASENGLPRPVESINPELARFESRGQARFARGLSAWVKLANDRPTLFEGPLADNVHIASAPTAAAPLLALTLSALQTHGRNADGGYAAFREPEDDGPAATDALATAWALSALRLAGEDDDATAASTALRTLVGPTGDVATARSADGVLDTGRALLTVQMATLEALLHDAEAGSREAQAAAEALWERLRAAWWDADAGVFMTSLGLADYVYTPGVAAQVIDALALATRADLPGANDTLTAFLGAVLGQMRAAETWLTGEFEHAGDSDNDGVSGVGAVAPDGVAPVFVPRVTF